VHIQTALILVNILSQKIIGRIINYHIGIRAQQSKECLIEFNGVNTTAAGKFVGQKVVWLNGKVKHMGKVVGIHGKNGVVRVKFSRPVPGQAIGSTVILTS
jgi:ribosomal protein L35AE/L33A